MSAKSILEADGKAILNYHLTRAPVIKPTPLPASSTHNAPPKLASLYFAADADVKGVLDQAEVTYPWLLVPGSKFVAKPDQLIKRRGKSGLLALNKPWAEAREWIEARAGKAQKVETVDGVLRQFLVEPFVPHPQDTEYYININSVREVRLFLFFRRSFHFRLRSRSGRAGQNPYVRRCPRRETHILSFMPSGERLLQKWERMAGSKADGRTAWFCLTAGRTKGTNTDPLLLHAIRTFLSHVNSPCLLALFVHSNLLHWCCGSFESRLLHACTNHVAFYY
jgi:hypothetical protein